MSSLFLLALGAFIGWSFPQPVWVKGLQEVVVSKLKSMFTK